MKKKLRKRGLPQAAVEGEQGAAGWAVGGGWAEDSRGGRNGVREGRAEDGRGRRDGRVGAAHAGCWRTPRR